MTADNASSNNVQVAVLYGLENSFDEANHVWCFNHTIQLSGKALIKPFNAGMSKGASGIENSTSDAPSLEEFNYDDDTDDSVDASLFEDKDEGNGNGNGNGMAMVMVMVMAMAMVSLRHSVRKSMPLSWLIPRQFVRWYPR